MKYNLLNIVQTTVLIICLLITVFGGVWTKYVCLLLLSYWILQGNYKESVRRFLQNKISICFLVPFVILFLRVSVQSPSAKSIQYIIKFLPLLICPFVLGSSCRLDSLKKRWILFSFVAFVVLNTAICYIIFMIRSSSLLNIRAISLFMPFIDYSLYVILGIAICVHYVFFEKIARFKKCLLLLSAIWLLFFTFYLKSLTGYLALFAAIFFSVIYIYKGLMSRFQRKVFFFLCAFVAIVIAALVYSEARYFIHIDKCDINKLDCNTSKGNFYTHNLSRDVENGHLVNVYVCQQEIEAMWQERTSLSVWAHDRWGNIYYYTLLRYMTSKNLRKDAEGLSELTDADIEAVKNGFTNYRFTNNKNPFKRIYEAFWELNTYYSGGNPNGHSIIQRFEFYKSAFSVIKEHVWFGCGTAVDVKLQQVYSENKILDANRWHLPHNQFILICCMCGSVGLLLYLLSLIGICHLSWNSLNTIKITWIVIVIVANCSKDFLMDMSGQLLFGFLGPMLFVTLDNDREDS